MGTTTGAMQSHLKRTMNRLATETDPTEIKRLRKMARDQRARIEDAQGDEHPMAAINARIAPRFAVPAAVLPDGGTSHLIADDDIAEAGETRPMAVSPHERAILECVREIDTLQGQLTKARDRMQRLVAGSLLLDEDA